jgi:hypothetical protein
VFRTRLLPAVLLLFALPLLADDTETYKTLRAAKVDGRSVAVENFTFERDAYRFTLNGALRLTQDGKVNWFFNQWVYGVAIPRYSSKFTVSDAGGGKYRISGSITQSEVPNDFVVVMPLYLQFDKQTIVRFGATAIIGNATKDVNVELALPRKPQAVAINANHDVLAR